MSKWWLLALRVSALEECSGGTAKTPRRISNHGNKMYTLYPGWRYHLEVAEKRQDNSRQAIRDE